MRRANVQLQSDRRDEILAAAQRCFVRSGFHGASMQDICAEAGMSPGNLYRYFPSKEALIAGIAERDRAEVGAAVRERRPLARLLRRARGHGAASFRRAAATSRCCCAPRSWRRARRNPEIARISAAFDADVTQVASSTCCAPRPSAATFPRDVDLDGAVTMLMIIADGVWWRRALDPAFDAGSRGADLHGHRPSHAPRPPGSRWQTTLRDNEETSR